MVASKLKKELKICQSTKINWCTASRFVDSLERTLIYDASCLSTRLHVHDDVITPVIQLEPLLIAPNSNSEASSRSKNNSGNSDRHQWIASLEFIHTNGENKADN